MVYKYSAVPCYLCTMAGKHHSSNPFVYSTDPDFSFEDEGEDIVPSTSQMILRVSLDNKHRKGKTVTLIEGFSGKREDRETLGKKLKASCGTGGSVKEGLIIIQGAHVEKVKTLLKEWGYHLK